MPVEVVVDGRKPVLFFGVNSEGLGHAMRARPVIQALSERYEVHVFCGGRARQVLAQSFPHVHPIWYGRIVYRNNACDVRTTVVRSFLEGPWVVASGALVTLMALWLRPVAVITDFECLTAWAGMLTWTKVISLDNQRIMQHGLLPPPGPEDAPSARVAHRVMFWTTPVLHRTLITSFFKPPLKPQIQPGRVCYVPVVVRPQVLALRSRVREDGKVLVYQTSQSNADLPETLRQAASRLKLRFVVYGTGLVGVDADGMVEYRRFSEEGFLSALSSAPFVITNGGHTTICEALALGKPVLAEPVHNQYEQSVNALGLEQLGVGRRTEKLTVDDITEFLLRVPALRARAKALDLVDNESLVRAVEQAIADVNPVKALPPRANTPPRPRTPTCVDAVP